VEAEETQVEDDESTQIVSSEEMTKADYEKEVAAATKKLEAKAEGVTNSKISASRSTTSDSDSYNTSYKKVTTSVVKLSNGKYRVKNDVTWSIMPKNRDFDVIGVGVQPQWAGNKGSEYGKQTWKEYDYGTRKTKTGYSQYSTTRNPSYWNIDGNGFGVKMNLKNDNKVAKTGVGWVGTEVRNLNLYMYYTVGKTVSNVKRIDAYGRYAHATTKLKPSFGFSVSTSIAAGFSFTLNKVSDFDITNKTVATIEF